MIDKSILQDFTTRLFHPIMKERIVITPMISRKKQINKGVVDLRLGTEFILTKKTRFSNLDINDEDLVSNIMKYQEKVSINIKDSIVLHPNQFILGSTLEYIKLPEDIIGYIIGRSSWGRLGLIIATATLINPGFAGVITLELTNVGEVPINLYPGLRMAQISFHICKFSNQDREKELGKYFGATSPSFSEVYKDYDRRLIEKENEEMKLIKKLIDSLLIIIDNNNEVNIENLFFNLKERIEAYKTKFSKKYQEKIDKIKNYVKSFGGNSS